MSSNLNPALAGPTRGQVTRAHVARFASLAFCGVLPALALVILFADAIQEEIAGIDFWQFRAAAQVILRGESPYLPESVPLTAWGGPYPYPPLPALLAVPFTTISQQAASLVVMAALVVVAMSVLWLLDVRDWRCYGLTLMWPPVLSAIQTGNVTLWLALACAIAWRNRDRVAIASASIGITLAAKFFLWPLVFWMAATRRLLSAFVTLAIGFSVLLASWAVIGFAGMTDYPDRLRQLDDLVGEDSYTLYIVGLDLGMPSPAARLLWLGVGLALLAATVVLGRRGDERTSFVVAVAASLALTPIVWLHYFALLLIPVAIARPRLGPVWFVPLAMIVTPGSGQPSPFDTAWTLAVAAVTVALSVWASRAESRQGVTARRMPQVT